MSDHTPSRRRSRPGRQAVGVRELKTYAARIVRRVRETRASFVLTHRGRAVGVILPLDAEHSPEAADEVGARSAWDAFLRAGRRLEGRFRPGVSGVEILSSMRR